MIYLGFIISTGWAYFKGSYDWTLLLVMLSIISGVGAVVMAIAKPDWYFNKRLEAGLDVDFSNPRKGIGGLVIVKAIAIPFLLWAAWHIAGKAGYI
jgi:hypothetical protein